MAHSNRNRASNNAPATTNRTDRAQQHLSPHLHDPNRVNTPITLQTKPASLVVNELITLYLTDPVFNTQLTSILTSSNDREHRGFYIDVIRLITGQTINPTNNQPAVSTNNQTSAALAHVLIGQPTQFIALSDEAVYKAQEIWKSQLETYHQTINRHVEMSIKPSHLLHSRPYNLPLLCSRQSINLVRSSDVDCLISVRGSIGRISSSRVYEFGLKYRCAKCHSEFFAYADESQENRISVPLKCAADSDTTSKPCRSVNIEPVTSNDSIVPRDIQTAKLQQTTQRGAINQSINQSINLVFKDELVERVKAGDEVSVVGVVRRQWASCVKEARIAVELYLDVMFIEVLSSIGRNDCASTGESESLGSQSEFGAFWLVHGPKHALAARDFIISSFAPSLFGMFVPKLAALLCVIGGCSEETLHSNAQTNQNVPSNAFNSGLTPATQVESDDVSGNQRNSLRIRGDIHCLFVGDPGTGKSQLLQFASLLSRRGIFTTGTGSTSAGLTVAAVREKRKRYDSASGSSEGGWILEPGALVLADGGVCCIDEFNGIAKADRLAIHEAMEQQTISVAKAGLVTTLHSRTAIIAALNPKGGDFDSDADLTVNTALGSPLLSRFDLILVLLDTRKEEWDEKIAHYILQALPTESDAVKKQEVVEDYDDEDQQHDEADQVVARMGRQPSIATQVSSRNNQSQESSSDGIRRNYGEVVSRSMPWSTNHLRSYVAHVRERAHPSLSTTCEALLKRYYQLQRRSDARKQARVTVRLLESLVRLTQAHARLMYRTRCIAQDAIVAIFLMENTISSCGLLTQANNPSIWSSASVTSSALHADFTEQPDLHYRQIERLLFSRLGVDYEQSQSADEQYLYEARVSTESNNQSIIQTQSSEPMYFSARSAVSPPPSIANGRSHSRPPSQSMSESQPRPSLAQCPPSSMFAHPVSSNPAAAGRIVDNTSQPLFRHQYDPRDQSSDQRAGSAPKIPKRMSAHVPVHSSNTSSLQDIKAHVLNSDVLSTRMTSTFVVPTDFDIDDDVPPAPRAPSYNPFGSVPLSNPNNLVSFTGSAASSQLSIGEDAITQATQTVYVLPRVIPSTKPRSDDPVPPPPTRFDSTMSSSQSNISNHTFSHKSNNAQAIVSANNTQLPSNSVPNHSGPSNLSSYQTPLRQVVNRTARSPTTNTPPPLSAVPTSRVGHVIHLNKDFKGNNPFAVAAAIQANVAPPSSTHQINGPQVPNVAEVSSSTCMSAKTVLLEPQRTSTDDDPFSLDSPPPPARSTWLNNLTNGQLDDLDLDM